MLNNEPVGMPLGLVFGEDGERGRDCFVRGQADAIVTKLASHLGWLEDLNALLVSSQSQ